MFSTSPTRCLLGAQISYGEPLLRRLTWAEKAEVMTVCLSGQHKAFRASRFWTPFYGHSLAQHCPAHRSQQLFSLKSTCLLPHVAREGGPRNTHSTTLVLFIPVFYCSTMTVLVGKWMWKGSVKSAILAIWQHVCYRHAGKLCKRMPHAKTCTLWK